MSLNQSIFTNNMKALHSEAMQFNPQTDKFVKAVDERMRLHNSAQPDWHLKVRFNEFCRRLKQQHNPHQVQQLFDTERV